MRQTLRVAAVRSAKVDGAWQPWRLLCVYVGVEGGLGGSARLRRVGAAPASGVDAAGGERSAPALQDLYVQLRRDLVRLAVALVDDVATAEDLVHDVFAAAQGRWNGLRDPDAAAAYLRRATLNRARSELRRRRYRLTRPVPAAVDQPAADDAVLLAEEHSRIVAAVRSLPSRQRDVVLLRYWQGLSEAQIALTLGISPGTVKSASSRGLTAVRRHLDRSEQ